MKAWVYIVTNKNNNVLYTGVTSNLKSRIESHKTKKYPNAFTARYNADKLVWFQEFDSSPGEIKSEILMQSIISQGKSMPMQERDKLRQGAGRGR